ncbi:EP300-interacting inhibitor of differentiation 3 [Bombyx mori]|uniref:Non-structural maintenance of chromosomes element 4 n=1 Tax=Bombyx mori TaxID=7091 RepID=A0A8R1WJL6_BOMMO|nr:EP300-interacting inhibitor of differentiation 3 [Bombyx mori]
MSTAELNSSQRKSKYISMYETVTALEDQNASNQECLDVTHKVVKEAKQLVQEGGVDHRSKHPGEGLLDARVLHASSNLAKMCLETVDVNMHLYDKNQLAQHIKNKPDFWDFTYPLEVPAVSYLYGAGTLQVSLPSSTRSSQSRSRVVVQHAQMRVPKNVDKVQQIENGPELVSRVDHFIKKQYKLNGRRPLSYYSVVLDPDSFSKTVENIYYVSFLVHDGLVAVELDETYGLPFISPREAPRDNDGALHDNQMIMSIDMKMWKELIEVFQISKPLMVIKRL